MSAIANAIQRMDIPSFRIRSGILAGLSMRHVVLAVVFTVGYDILGNLGFIGLTGLPEASRWKAFSLIAYHLAVASSAVLAAVAAENTFNEGSVRSLRYPAAVIIASAVGTWILWIFSPPMSERSVKGLAALAQLGDMRLMLLGRDFLSALYICIVVVALHAVLEAGHKAAAALHTARLQALDDEHDACAAELGAMQARVDPELLFESLRAIDAAYANDPVLGQAKLEALIRFLRAALPGMPRGRSTVEHERELVEAYLALVASGSPAVNRPVFTSTPATMHQEIPPMILLPLVRWALANESAEGLTISLNSRSSRSGDRLELIVENKRPVACEMHNDDTEIVRRRLEDLYAQDMRFEVSAENNCRRAIVEFPTSATNAYDPRLAGDFGIR